MEKKINLALILSTCLILGLLTGCDESASAKQGPGETLEAKIEKTEQGVQGQAEEQLEKAENHERKPKVTLEKDTHDFGDVDPGSKNKAEYIFKNEGDGTLKITKIRSTCGCTIPQLKKKTYLAGESGTIKLTFTAGQRSGPVKKSLYVLSNDPDNPKLPFYIKANVAKKINYKPQRLKLRFDKEDAGIEDIKIESLDKRKFAISRIVSRPDCISFDFDPAKEDLSFVLSPKVDMEKLKNVKNGSVSIYLTHPSQKSISIGFSVLPPYKTDPATLIALNIEPGKPARKVLYVLSNYGEEIEVESVEATNDVIKIVSEEKLPDKHIITVDITAPELTDRKRHFNSKLIIKMADGQELSVSCVGSIKK